VKNQRKNQKTRPKARPIRKNQKIKPTGARPIRKNQKIESSESWVSMVAKSKLTKPRLAMGLQTHDQLEYGRPLVPPTADKIQPSVMGLHCTFFQSWGCTATLFFLLRFFLLFFLSFFSSFSFLSTALGIESDVTKLIL
jgi:hypothetical protein